MPWSETVVAEVAKATGSWIKNEAERIHCAFNLENQVGSAGIQKLFSWDKMRDFVTFFLARRISALYICCEKWNVDLITGSWNYHKN